MELNVKEDKQFYFQWHFLGNCNLRCKHCYQEDYAKSELDLEQLFKIADQIILALDKWDMYGRISLTGGEPFLSENLFPLLEYLNSKNRVLSINILTNGTLIDEETIPKLKKVEKLKQIQISLDGSDAESHNLVRGKMAFEKSINAIRILKKADIEVALMYTLMPNNINSVMDFIKLAEKENVDYITVERVTPCGQGSEMTTLTSEDIKTVYTEITKYANTMQSNLKIRRARPLWINTLKDNTCENAVIGGFCPIGLTAIAILWDGTVLPCRRLEIPIGNILTDGIFKIWYGSEVLWNIRDKKKLKGKCGKCENIAFCGGCRANAYAFTGDYMEGDTQCWK